MGLMVERPAGGGVEVVQGLSFRSLASQVGCGGPQSQCVGGQEQRPASSPPFTVLGPSSAGAGWGKGGYASG